MYKITYIQAHTLRACSNMTVWHNGDFVENPFGMDKEMLGTRGVETVVKGVGAIIRRS